jgi:hypothetical protein
MIDNHVIHARYNTYGTIDLLLTIPLILVKELVFGTDYSEANSLASVVTLDIELSGHAKEL